MTQSEVIGLIRLMLRKEIAICRLKMDTNPSELNQSDLAFFKEAERVFEQFLDIQQKESN